MYDYAGHKYELVLVWISIRISMKGKWHLKNVNYERHENKKVCGTWSATARKVRDTWDTSARIR